MFLYLSGVTGNPHDNRFSDGIDDNRDGLIETGDSRCNKFYHSVMDCTFNSNDWVQVSEVLDHALVMFGDLKGWFNYQLTQNNKVTGHLAEYLIDTMGYILDGKRTMHQESWLTLLTMSAGKQNQGTANYLPHAALIKARLEENSSHELLQMWLSKKNGVLDLIDTLFTLFGVPVQKDLREPI